MPLNQQLIQALLAQAGQAAPVQSPVDPFGQLQALDPQFVVGPGETTRLSDQDRISQLRAPGETGRLSDEDRIRMNQAQAPAPIEEDPSLIEMAQRVIDENLPLPPEGTPLFEAVQFLMQTREAPGELDPLQALGATRLPGGRLTDQDLMNMNQAPMNGNPDSLANLQSVLGNFGR